mmetsp:Transcript_10222/g.26555  ORF Transcript_10222/g.26555 Transcript_10222/m.26555 type:complete len:234 (-) Transcript_10222:32-733(-)
MRSARRRKTSSRRRAPRAAATWRLSARRSHSPPQPSSATAHSSRLSRSPLRRTRSSCAVVRSWRTASPRAGRCSAVTSSRSTSQRRSSGTLAARSSSCLQPPRFTGLPRSSSGSPDCDSIGLGPAQARQGGPCSSSKAFILPCHTWLHFDRGRRNSHSAQAHVYSAFAKPPCTAWKRSAPSRLRGCTLSATYRGRYDLARRRFALAHYSGSALCCCAWWRGAASGMNYDYYNL